MEYTFRRFRQELPNDDACLDRIMELRYGDNPQCPSCRKRTNFYRISGRRSYACQWCGHHVYPCVGTPFEKSSTPITLWFYAMYLMTATQEGVSFKELERQLGVTYKCAWRIGRRIRKLMTEKNAESNLWLNGKIGVAERFKKGKR